MQINDIHWTWYMWATVPHPVVERRPAYVQEAKHRRVEEASEIYDRDGNPSKKAKSSFVIKA